MKSQTRELLRLDLDAIDLRKGLTGLVAVLVLVVLVAIFGTIGLVAALATFFVIVADRPGAMRDRAIGVLSMTLIGSILAFVGAWAGSQHIVVAALVTFIVVALATVAASLGPASTVRAMLVSVWAVMAVSIAGETDTALQMAIAFTAGGLVAAGVLWMRSRAEPPPSIEPAAPPARHAIGGVLRSPAGWFALLRATAAGLAMLLGGSLFPEHASWAALTVILLMKPKAGETIAAGLLRSIGTLAGVIAAEAVIILSGGEAVVVAIAFLVFAFATAALHKVNYAVFVMCLTGVLVLADQLASGTGESTAIDRLLATLLGAAIAFAGIALGRRLLGRSVLGEDSDPPAVDEEPTPS